MPVGQLTEQGTNENGGWCPLDTLGAYTEDNKSGSEFPPED